MSKPYRDQKIDRFCYTCHEPAGSVCAGCGRAFCAEHAPRLWRGCSSCEAAYATAARRWGPGGWLGFLILVGGAVAGAAVAGGGFALSSDGKIALLTTVATLVVVAAAAVLSRVLPRRFFFRARRARLAAAEEAATSKGYPFALGGETEPAREPSSQPASGSLTALALAIVSLFVGFLGLAGCLIAIAAVDMQRDGFLLLAAAPNVLALGGFVIFGSLWRLHERRATGARLSDRQLTVWVVWAVVSVCVGGLASIVAGASL